MPRRSPIALTTLEAREVPAAGPFADIFPGIWGSFPHDFTTSGKTLFFAADNGHGDEVYASDGTPGGTKIVKDLSPGRRGSNPQDITAAGNGVVFFTADDGTGRALYKSNGTAAGTAKVPGVPAGAVFDSAGAVGLNGSLVFVVPQGATSGLFRTDGGVPVRLGTIQGTAQSIPGPYVANGRAYFPSSANDDAVAQAVPSLWSTDGTVAGTFSAAGRRERGTAEEVTPVAELAPGKWLMHRARPKESVNDLYTLDATGEQTRVASINSPTDPETGTPYYRMTLAFPNTGSGPVVGGKVFFTVQTNNEDPYIWSTDGTTAGTRQVASWGTGLQPSWIVGQFAGRAIVADIQPGGYGYGLTDGTPEGTTRIGRPPVKFGDGNWLPQYLGNLSPSAAYPNGLMVFSDEIGGVGIYVTDLTPQGSRTIDSAVLPREAYYYALPGALGQWTQRGDAAQLGGTVYFAGPRVGEVRPEPWKFEIAPAAVTPPVRPVTATVTVNDGDRQRSTVTKITVSFDRAMLLTPGAFELRNQLTGKLIPLTQSSPRPGGATVLDFSFAGLPGGLADGTYTFTIRAADVRAIGGGTLSADSVTTVTRLFGDLDGDGRYDRASRWMLHERVGAKRGDARYLAAFDVDGDGVIGAADELAVVRNWSKQ